MSLAIVIGGIVSEDVAVKCLESFKINILDCLSSVFNKIDFFLISDRRLDCYDAIKFKESSSKTRLDFIIDSIDLIEPHTEYTHIIFLRPDVYFYRKLYLKDFHIDWFNFSYCTSELGMCDDSFWLFPRNFGRKYPSKLSSLQFMRNFLLTSKTTINYQFDLYQIHFISRRVETTKGYYMPDFWYLLDGKTYKLYEWVEPKIAICLCGKVDYRQLKEQTCRFTDYKRADFFVVTNITSELADIIELLNPIDMILDPKLKQEDFVKLVFEMIYPYRYDYKQFILVQNSLLTDAIGEYSPNNENVCCSISPLVDYITKS